MANRRSFLQSVAGLTAGLLASDKGLAASPRRPASRPHVPAVTTEVGDLPFTMDGNVKVFHLVAEVLKQEIAPGKTIDVWGFNGSAPGPTIQVFEGDRVRVLYENRLPEPSSMHWHGFEDPIANDGQPGISQNAVPPGGTFTYEFDIHQTGTYFYHSHMAMQEMAGLLGAFIMHPRESYAPYCDKDFVIHLQEYAVLSSNTVPDTMKMEFNWLVMNGKAAPATTPLIVRLGDRVRIRFINMGMDHHPMHLHGHTFHVTGTEGGRIPETAWWPGNTVLVGVAQARDVEFMANNPGDWMLHCHLPHHMMNQMSSIAGRMTRGDGMGMAGDVAPNANNVPNYPQDAFMEGPMMTMDKAVDRPENLGLRAGWSQYMQGMMTFVRVLPPEKYDAVIAKMQEAKRPNDPYSALLKTIVTLIVTFAIALTAPAQDMPGMKMPEAPRPHAAAPSPAKSGPHATMPGMDMTVQHTPDTHDTMRLQEPENAARHTGSDTPAPDLLQSLEAQPALGLADFLTTAEQRSPALAQAQTLARADNARAFQAGLYPNPAIGYQGEQIRGGSYGGGEQGAYLEQQIVLGGKLGLRRDVYTRQARADAATVDAQRTRVKNDVTQAFYEALAAQTLAGLRKQMLDLALDAVETSHQLANVGQADAPDILQSEVEAEQAKVDYVTAQRQYLERFATLRAYAGTPELPVRRLAGDLESPPEIDAEKLAASLVETNPLLLRSMAEATVSDARIKAARREVVPDITVRAGEQYNFEHITDFPARATGPQSFASASITLPLWNRNQGAIAAEQADAERVRLEVARTRLTLQHSAALAAQSYLTARFTADRYKTEMIPRAERACELYKAKYEAMAVPYPQVLNSQRMLLQIRMGYIMALTQLWRAGTDIQYGTLHGALDAAQ